MWFELNFVWLLTPAGSYMGYKNIQSGTINLKKETNEDLDIVVYGCNGEKPQAGKESSEQGLKGTVINYMEEKKLSYEQILSNGLYKIFLSSQVCKIKLHRLIKLIQPAIVKWKIQRLADLGSITEAIFT